MVSQISNEINPLGAPLEVESVENNPVRAGAQLFSDGGQFLHAAKGSNLRCRFQSFGSVEIGAFDFDHSKDDTQGFSLAQILQRRARLR
jgi:hypothetical protein